MKILRYVLIVILVPIVFYLLGPRPHFQAFDNTPTATEWELEELESRIATREAANPAIKPGNHARIIWADSVRKSPYSIVYLHGFSASEREGFPVHENIAKRFGCNLYLTRLPGHGISGDSIYKDMEPAVWVEEAKKAIAVGKVLGEEVIVMATSTGATLGTYLAAGDPSIKGLIFYAPNVDLYDGKSVLLNGPWGERITQTIFQGVHREWPGNDTVKAYWTTRYHVDGLHALRELVDVCMQPKVFAEVEQPLFVSYYYRDEEHQDDVVSVEAIREFISLVGTPQDDVRVYVTDNAGTHAVASSIWNENWEEVETATVSFIEEVLGIPERSSLLIQ